MYFTDDPYYRSSTFLVAFYKEITSLVYLCYLGLIKNFMTALDVNKKSIVYEIKTLRFDHPLFKDFLINISYKETGSKSCTHFVYFGFGSGYKHIG